MKNTIENAKKFINQEDIKTLGLARAMVAYADQYSTLQEGRGRYVTDDEIERYSKTSHNSAYFELGARWMRLQIFTSPPEMGRQEAITFADWIVKHQLQKYHFGWVRLPTSSALYCKTTYELYDRFKELTSPPRSVGDKKDEV